MVPRNLKLFAVRLAWMIGIGMIGISVGMACDSSRDTDAGASLPLVPDVHHAVAAAPHKLGASLDGSVANSQFTLTTPIAAQFAGDAPITGVFIRSVNLDFDAQTATVFVSAIGGSTTNVYARVIVLNIPGAEATTLLGQIKTGIASSLGVSFQ